MIIIGLIGKKESGKTTFAKYLIDYFVSQEICAIKAAFGDKLKNMLIESGLCTYNEVYVEKTPQSRMLMQKIATEVVRTVDYDYWCKQLWLKLREACRQEPRGIVVVDDVRFRNEHAMLSSLNAIIVRVDRPGLSQEDNHQSETEMDCLKHRVLVYNDGGLDYLKRTAVVLGKSIAEKKSVEISGRQIDHLDKIVKTATTTLKHFTKEKTSLWRSFDPYSKYFV